MKYAHGEIRGANARCRAMFQVFSTVLDDYFPGDHADTTTSTSTTSATGSSSLDIRAHFDQFVLKPSFTFWTTRCRPHSVSMGNAFTFLKTAVASLSRDISLVDMKETLKETIERYLSERLEYAGRAIAQHAMAKMEHGDVVLTYGKSETIPVLLTTAKQEGINFYVWVVDSRPLLEGKLMLQKLVEADIPCGYIQLNALTYVMQQVTKVFLGAKALMSNGSIYGRIGTAGVALLAKDKNIPVLVCCETYKISNKVQLESITQNELGNPEALVHGESLNNWKDVPNLKLLNLLYDVTPAEFVSGVVTEVGIIPPTSIAVLLREMNPQDGSY
jgi:translation initiation factor eIF-2B subunit delta